MKFQWLLSISVLLIYTTGCEAPENNPTIPTDKESATELDKTTTKQNESEHAHVDGSHGGNIISVGADSYHVEAVFETGGTIRLFMLGQDETRIQEIDTRPLNGFIKPRSLANATPITFSPNPVEGDSPGMTSQFIAQIPAEWVDQEIEVTIPNLQIDGERFRIAFSTPQAQHSSEPSMPSGAANDEAVDLYLTPGGAYTMEDIEANGNLTAAKKFKGVMSAHDMKPKPGDRICPITMTKANPNFSWVVGGKTYLFCCPPCVDEFVRMAKNEPEKILNPEDYVKASPETTKQGSY